MKKLGLYIHIPYCEHKCIYCDFYSIINFKNVDEYFSAIQKEIEIRAKEYSKNHIIESIFFGGGTPSLVDEKFINQIITTIYKNFSVSQNVEITIETNPGTVDKLKLISFFKMGINRISVGIQSFDEEDLRFLTRIHSKQQAIATIENAREIGFENISLDLIFNLPNQTLKKWGKNLEIAVKLPIKHISTYSLILEHGTILNAMVEKGKVQIGEENHDAELYLFTQNFLEENDFKQYEVSNFAKTKFESVHNKLYWHHENYLGFGTSAHSFVDGKRWWNFKSLIYYLKSANENNFQPAGYEFLTEENKLEEFIMLSLRSDGIRLENLSEKYGNDWLKKNERKIEQYISQKLISRDKTHLRLTKIGYAVCDEILANLSI